MPDWTVVSRPVSGYELIDLSGHLDNDGVAGGNAAGGAGFNIWSNRFPAEDLPDGQTVDVGGIPFRFPPTGDGRADNIRCDRQLVPLPPGRYDWLYLIGAAERRTEDWVHLHYTGGAIDPEWLRISDFWPAARPFFGERVAVRAGRLLYPHHSQPNMAPVLWRQRIPVPRQAELAAVRLPENPAIHIFALTAQETPAGARS
jgi:hypothetical protein